ncbi:MAG: DNA mismatch repair endonuclease MutL [Candidatus Lokiarchaeota archaeon]|nr:DNA mismatch repair endonuclease MutL [Candidatus Lokiarchaeota archaeon]
MTERKIRKIIEAEKIAAGEVVERPANIVKELIENSIDAGAKEIRIIIKKAGKSLIHVIDDGVGISPEDIEIAFERHTSSKIRSIEDLETLSTLGFRGEALASIAAVSQVEIISRSIENERGVHLTIEGGKVKGKKEISSQVGTDIKVKNIFYNIPARQKFLKKDSTELSHITDFIQRYSLAFPEIHFIYRHNDLDILNCPANNDLKTTVFHIYGKNTAKYMEPINYVEEDSFIKIKGLLGHPQISKKNRSYSSLFINKRYVVSDVLFRAIKEAYEGTLMTSKYPFFVIFLDLDPSVVDFNVHPKKLHVRFEKEDVLYNRVYNIIRSFVENSFIKKEAKYISTELDPYIQTNEREIAKKVKTIEESQDIEKDLSKTVKLLKEETDKTEESVQLNLLDQVIEKKDGSESYLRGKYIISKNFPKVRLISSTGQLSNKIYIILEGINDNKEEGMFILDQHAAAERITKEKLLNDYESVKGSKQKLIQPLNIDVSPSDRIFLEDNLKEIKRTGFNFEHFGGNTFILREIPTIMNKLPDANIIKEIISDITEIGKDRSFKEAKEEIINYLACHRSIRGNDDLSLKDIRKLLMDLAECKDSYHCAHGRPTLRFISYKELDKLFKRTG